MSLNGHDLLKQAEQRTGLQDWGGDDFREPFKMLVRALNENAELSQIGEQRSRAWLILRLEQRLRLFDDRKRISAIAEQTIERPIFVTGMPRAGTTFMHGLLAADPAAISPRFWQLLSPSPPPNAAGIDHGATIAAMNAFLESQGWMTPEALAIHDSDAKTPEECPFVFELSFISSDFTGWWHVPGYFPALGKGFGPAYAIHRKVLQAMQVGAAGRRWVLKAPEHCAHLNELLDAYPDAIIVQHHRDPAKVMASMLSAMAQMQSRYSDVAHMNRNAAQHFIAMYAGALRNVTAQRKTQHLENKIIDIHYRALERDPMGQIEHIYEKAGLRLSDAGRAEVKKTIAGRAKGRHGVHQYKLSDYGLTAEEIHTAFSEYLKTYDVELEL